MDFVGNPLTMFGLYKAAVLLTCNPQIAGIGHVEREVLRILLTSNSPPIVFDEAIVELEDFEICRAVELIGKGKSILKMYTDCFVSFSQLNRYGVVKMAVYLVCHS